MNPQMIESVNTVEVFPTESGTFEPYSKIVLTSLTDEAFDEAKKNLDI